jgi:hypothetical protein
MPDDTKKRDWDRGRVSANEYYEVEYFARQNGISPAQVCKLIKKVGNSRAALTEAAKKLQEQ